MDIPADHKRLTRVKRYTRLTIDKTLTENDLARMKGYTRLKIDKTVMKNDFTWMKGHTRCIIVARQTVHRPYTTSHG
jgi:hypothetical protein